MNDIEEKVSLQTGKTGFESSLISEGVITDAAKVALEDSGIRALEGVSATAFDTMIAGMEGVAYGPVVVALAFVPGMDAVFGTALGALGATWDGATDVIGGIFGTFGSQSNGFAEPTPFSKAWHATENEPA